MSFQVMVLVSMMDCSRFLVFRFILIVTTSGCMGCWWHGFGGRFGGSVGMGRQLVEGLFFDKILGIFVFSFFLNLQG